MLIEGGSVSRLRGGGGSLIARVVCQDGEWGGRCNGAGGFTGDINN